MLMAFQGGKGFQKPKYWTEGMKLNQSFRGVWERGVDIVSVIWQAATNKQPRKEMIDNSA